MAMFLSTLVVKLVSDMVVSAATAGRRRLTRRK